LSYPRVVVAADQLEQAREIAARPIPQEIIDEFNAPPEEYKPPVCPKCGAEDPVLESADPVNSWLCESCGEQWSDPAEAADVTA
jgi:tRNA(Ile2) C34 agmatinyltransferase TiaS